MPTRRTKSINTKITEAEYDQLARLAEPLTISEWARAVLLRARTEPRDVTVMAELLALRTIVINLLFVIAAQEQVTLDGTQRVINRADAEKWQRAEQALAAGPPRIDLSRQ